MGKYNLKNIMLGIGIGLVIASMANINKGSSQLTVEEIKKEAQKNGLIVLTVDEIINKQAPEEVQVPAEQPAQAITPTQTPAVVQAPTPTPAQTPSSQRIEVNIKSGMSSEEIAELLEEKGLLRDTKSFLRRLGELEMDERLKVGSFEINKGTGIDEIIKILTR